MHKIRRNKNTSILVSLFVSILNCILKNITINNDQNSEGIRSSCVRLPSLRPNSNIIYEYRVHIMKIQYLAVISLEA